MSLEAIVLKKVLAIVKQVNGLYDYVKIAEDASIRAQQYAYEFYRAVSAKTERTTTVILIDID
ncbi:hypothetical protein GVN22_26320 [Cellulophaga sp. BC115SP]|nr:hypothetical protein [Cellulophaga sp. BC115SP]